MLPVVENQRPLPITVSEQISVEMKDTPALGVRIEDLFDSGEEVLTTVLKPDVKNIIDERLKDF